MQKKSENFRISKKIWKNQKTPEQIQILIKYIYLI